MLRIPQPTTKHHGGLLLFGPDEHLYIGSGDGGPSGDPDNVAQNKRVLLGKLLRIDPAPSDPSAGERQGGRRLPYTVPADNPLSAARGATRSSPTGCATPGASPSTEPPGDLLTIGDVGDSASRRSTSCRRARRAAPTSAGRPTRATSSSAAASSAGAHGPARLHLPARARAARSPAATSSATPASPGSTGREIVGRYIFGDFCTGAAVRLPPQPEGARPGAQLPLQAPGA